MTAISPSSVISLPISSPSSPPPPPQLDPNAPPLPSASSMEGLPTQPAEIPDDLYLDDDALSAVEKIYLLSRSKHSLHRVFISRSLHTFLPDVPPLEAIEYILPLLNSLAMDDDDTVKEALVSNLIAIMWWFFENCQLVEEDLQFPLQDFHDPPWLPVQTFTPFLNSLLIDHNNMISGPARFTVVEILNRLRAADDRDEDNPPFASKQRKMLEQEIVYQVIIGMGRLDALDDSPPPQTSQSVPVSPHSLSIPLSTQDQSSPLPPDPPLPELPPDNPSLSHDSSPAQESPQLQSSSDQEGLGMLPMPNLETSEQPSLMDDAKEQAAVGRLSSMSLIATVTANAKLPEETVCAFADEVSYVGGDPLYWVRREASFAVGALAKVVPIEVLTLTLLPLFDALSHDSVWHVRHSAVFALPNILARLTPHHRRTLALDTLLLLSRDPEPTVRSGVLEVLGEVIYAFHQDEEGVPGELIELFVGSRRSGPPSPGGLILVDADKPPDTPSPERGGSDTLSSSGMSGTGILQEPTRGLITSFNYPAVALSLGPQRWNEVRGYYLALPRDPNLRVRRTVAAGLGEMARILGADHAQRDLVGIWDRLVHDAEDGETRLKALAGIEMFVGALEGETQGGVVRALPELWDQRLSGWRERECLTRALPRLASLVNTQGEVIRTLMRRALVDSVAAVREAAIEAVFPVLMAFDDRPHFAEGLRDDLHSLAQADLCRRRVTYIACCQALLERENGEAEIAREGFWDNILSLSKDRIVDVRIGIARLLAYICDKFYPDPDSRPVRLSEAVHRLGQDPSRDVRAYVAFLLVPAGMVKARAQVQTVVGFATFSRPPRKTVVLGPMIEGIRDLSFRDHRLDPAVPQDLA